LDRIADDLARRGETPPRFWANIMLAIPGETREEAFATMRMLRRMRHVLPSISFYAPYPGSALGYQLMVEGRSRMTSDNYHRYPSEEKLAGVDYRFYRDLLAGRYDREVEASGWPDPRDSGRGNSFSAPHRFYLFETTAGHRKLAWGRDPQAAFEV